MKNKILAILLLVVFISCEKETSRRSNNPYLPNYSFSALLNLSLPSYIGLNSNSNPIAITIDNDIDILIMKISDGNYVAWNGNCPSHSLSSCSKLIISGLNSKCNCEGYTYSLYSGDSQTAPYPMINYRVEVLGNNTIRVYN
jgi:nitrite reductase/ring-hydroxylating ferredoxin subunit